MSAKHKDLIERCLVKMKPGHTLVQIPGSRILNLRYGGQRLVEIEVKLGKGNQKKFLTRLRDV